MVCDLPLSGLFTRRRNFLQQVKMAAIPPPSTTHTTALPPPAKLTLLLMRGWVLEALPLLQLWCPPWQASEQLAYGLVGRIPPGFGFRHLLPLWRNLQKMYARIQTIIKMEYQFFYLNLGESIFSQLFNNFLKFNFRLKKSTLSTGQIY